MDSIFCLDQYREGCSWTGGGGARPFAIQPCPVEPLLQSYLPEWIVRFLSDLWKRVRLHCFKYILIELSIESLGFFFFLGSRCGFVGKFSCLWTRTG